MDMEMNHNHAMATNGASTKLRVEMQSTVSLKQYAQESSTTF